MKTRLHKMATTTPAIRKKIQESDASISDAALGREFNLHPATIKKWRRRDFTEDLSSKRHHQPSSLSDVAQAAIVVLRRDVRLMFDDVVLVIRECFHPKATEASIYRCMVRNGVNRLPPLPDGEARARQPFPPEALPGFLHMDVKYLTRLKGKRAYVYLAIDRATRYVFAEVFYDLKPATAALFLKRVMAKLAKLAIPVRVVLTDNGFEFTDRCAGGYKPKATGKHAVDVLCAAHGIEHRLTRPRHPWTNGMAERANRRLGEALASKEKISANSGRNCFASHAERNKFIANFVYNYNHTRLKCIGHKTPTQLMHDLAKVYTQAGISTDFKYREIPACAGMT